MLQQTITTTTDPLPLFDEVEEECTNVSFSAPPNMNELLQQFRENLLFFQTKYILNIDTGWLLCGKLLIPVSFCCHYDEM